MDSLPNFSNSKIDIKNRIEGALREKKRRPGLYQLSFFFCFFIFTTACTAVYLKNLLFVDSNSVRGDIDYYSLEMLLLSEQLESETVIQLPKSLSFISVSEPTLISNVDYKKGEL